MKTTISSAFLLTSTLSLVIALQNAEQLGTISPEISGILVLSAVITCVFVPIVFKKLFPIPEETKVIIKVSFIGKTNCLYQLLKVSFTHISNDYVALKDLADHRNLDESIKT